MGQKGAKSVEKCEKCEKCDFNENMSKTSVFLMGFASFQSVVFYGVSERLGNNAFLR